MRTGCSVCCSASACPRPCRQAWAPDALVERMRLDKKADAHGLRFVLWDGIGEARVVSGVAEESVRAVLAVG